MSVSEFNPPFLFRNKHLQTILASKKSPLIGGMVNCQELVNISVDVGEIVHLNGFYSKQAVKPSKGLVLLLHGWLGSDRSTYMLARGEALYQQGYDIFRLNFRDHGNTLNLNTGIFHGGRLEEAFAAVKEIAAFNPEMPVYIIGFSMGGSFALRIAWLQGKENLPIKNLRKVIAVCPSVNPDQVTSAIDNSLIYRNYFCAKWKENLKNKQHHFSDLYDFSELLNLKTCREMTEILISKYSEYPDIDTYFSDYQFSFEKLKEVKTPTIILTAEDDPVIPIIGFKDLKNANQDVEIRVTQYGGHVGFIEGLNGESWLDKILPQLL
jgi:predicted alpha/beta-fold hydrolase